MKIRTMSDNVVDVMQSLRYNDRLVNLLLIDSTDSPFTIESRPKGFESNTSNMDKKNIQIINQNSSFCRISPTPFNPNAEEEDKSMIRVYYNQGEFDSEIISESTLHIDIIVAKSIWLAYDQTESRLIIRPYEMIETVMDTVGRLSGNPTIRLNFEGWQHLAVNTKFDAIRLYAEYFKPEV